MTVPSLLSRLAGPALLLLLAGAPAAARDNVLLVVGDDMGVDRVAVYGEESPVGPTPLLDLLANHGVWFRNAYSNPVCSPTRTSILTGRYGFRTGIGTSVKWTGDPGEFEPLPQEATLPEALARTHRAVAVGKWHLANLYGFGYQHPIQFGFDQFTGAPANIGGFNSPPINYFEWHKNVANRAGNVQFEQVAYATTDNVDDALALIKSFGGDPWFMWLAFNAPHTPYHVPPDDLITLNVNEFSGFAQKHRAAIEALDTELGRLLGSMRKAVLARTWIIFVGDNGTPGKAVKNPQASGKAKGTIYEFGVNVPLIVYGPDIVQPGREVAGLVNTTDLYATVLELAGAPPVPAAEDSISIVPYLRNPGQASLRDWAYVEKFVPNGFGPKTTNHRAVRNARYKLVQRDSQRQFFDLQVDPIELNNLLPYGSMLPVQQQAYDELDVVLQGLGF